MAAAGADQEDLLVKWAPLVALRRRLHMYPEVGYKEFVTHCAVRRALEEIAGLDPASMKRVAGTGLVCDIFGTGEAAETDGRDNDAGADETGDQGTQVRAVALRADLDGLPMTEGAALTASYRSRREGFAHACGHDGHMTVLVGVAAVLNSPSIRRRIPRNRFVRLLFQPAEEFPGGAERMIEEGALDGVDEVYGWHNWPVADWPLGFVAVREGTVMARDADFHIEIRGQGGHASAPAMCIDPIVAGSTIVSSLQTLVSRFTPSAENCVVSVAMFQAGEATNVIPDSARIAGTIRDLGGDVLDNVIHRMKSLVNSIAEGYGCSATVHIHHGYCETSNEKHGVEVVRRCAGREPHPALCGEGGLPMMGSEDFGYFLKERPGCFFLVGTAEPTVAGLAAMRFSTKAAERQICRDVHSATIETRDGGCFPSEEIVSPLNMTLPQQDSVEVVWRSRSSMAELDEDDAEEQVERPRGNEINHSTAFDFNDNVIPRVVTLFLNIVEDRLATPLENSDAHWLFEDTPEGLRLVG